MKKEIKKKTNIHIYIITFAVTFIGLWIYISFNWNKLVPAEEFNQSNSDNLPDASVNITTLFMLSDTKGGFPDYFMLINYRPRNNVITIVPLNPKTILGGDTISNIYRKGAGASGVMRAIESEMNISCKRYVKFDKQSFEDFTTAFGDATVNLPNEIKTGGTSYPAGKQNLSGEKLYNLLTLTDISEETRETLQGSAIASLINRNFQNLDADDFQEFFKKILANTDTDLTMDDYTENQKSYLYTTLYGADIADYYLPYGSDTGSGFSISPDSVTSIKDKFGAM
jgi:anionic cell wall polymer biosynthesis LytR-Cps2A-Psr (LCP) family protein